MFNGWNSEQEKVTYSPYFTCGVVEPDGIKCITQGHVASVSQDLNLCSYLLIKENYEMALITTMSL